MALLIKDIKDGYTLDGHIPKFRKSHQDITFKYRPALPEYVYDYTLGQKRFTSGKEALKIVTELLTKHLVAWDVLDEKGETIPVTAEALKHLPHYYLERLAEVVIGYGPDEVEADEKN